MRLVDADVSVLATVDEVGDFLHWQLAVERLHQPHHRLLTFVEDDRVERRAEKFLFLRKLVT